MPSVLEAVSTTMQQLMERDPREPVHVGEAMSCWTYYGALREAIAMAQTGLNTTMDDELRHILEEGIKKNESQAKRLEAFMKSEGIPFPPTSADKPKSDPSAVPLGVKATDAEIANAVAISVTSGIIACAASAAEAIRNDVSLMWTEFQSEQLTFGMTLKNVMRNRGWLKIPPAFTPPGTPVE